MSSELRPQLPENLQAEYKRIATHLLKLANEKVLCHFINTIWIGSQDPNPTFAADSLTQLLELTPDHALQDVFRTVTVGPATCGLSWQALNGDTIQLEFDANSPNADFKAQRIDMSGQVTAVRTIYGFEGDGTGETNVVYQMGGYDLLPMQGSQQRAPINFTGYGKSSE
ncbi:MAG: hypothetical protein NUV65_05325 [Candidatus Roizmanbacteria bacterium]|nr:hypothetical protein [Candidatus Roizmanbacteria bacterium]